MITFSLPTALLTVGILAAPPAYRTYHNERFGYRIDYPTTLTPQPEAGNGDGRRFVSADGHTVLTVYAAFNVYEASDGDALTQDWQLAQNTWQQRGATFSLSRKLPTGYVLSGQVHGHIFYEKAVLRANTFTTFSWEYPSARKAVMDAVIQHTLCTLQPSVAGSN
ncbi:hypothetical protein [Hymenobacter psoromatis]|uniref:hypothetical protein n=1 Tax=Hymenobacter psoromatis TaxID=1484116 RepID=UPI001CBAD83A|nr:hypothetical protein [Hymenobacter psoromatis]